MATSNPFAQSPFDDLTRTAQEDADKLLAGQQAVKPLATPELKAAKAPAAAEAEVDAAPEPAARRGKSTSYLPPADITPIFEAAAQKYDVPVNVLMALGHQESRYDPNAIGTPTEWGRARGMMQYLDGTAKGLGINPFDPKEAIPAAARQIRQRLDNGASMIDAVKEHFAGPDRKQWGAKTAAYGDEVMAKAFKIGGDTAGQPAQAATGSDTAIPADWVKLTPEQAAEHEAKQANHFSTGMSRPAYEQTFRANNPQADQNAVDMALAQFDQQKQARGKGKIDAVTQRFETLKSPEATFDAKLNAKLAGAPDGIVPALPGKLVTPPKPAFDANAAASESQLDAASSYLGKSFKSGMYDLAGAGAKVLDAINPWTLSESDAATLFKDDPDKLKQFQDDSAAMVLSRFAKEMTKHGEGALAEMSDRAKRDYGNLEYATTDTSKAAYMSPTKVIGDALKSLPSSIAMGLSVYLTRGAAARAEQSALAAGLSPELAQQAAVAAGAKAMGTAGAASEGVVGYAQQANQSMSDVGKLTDEQLAKSPQYQDLLRHGYTASTARAKVAADTAEQAGQLAGIVDAAVNKVGGEFLGKILTEGGKFLPRVMKGAANESATEFVQSAGEQVGQNMATRSNVDPNQSMTQGVGEAALAGAAVGGLTGGTMAGAGGRGHVATAQAPAPVADVAPITPPAPPPGPLSGAVEAAAAPAGPTTQVMGDDGQVHTISEDADGNLTVVAPEPPPGPLTASLANAAEQHAAAPGAPDETALAEIEATKPKPPPEPAAPPDLSTMPLEDLRARKDYIIRQAKASGGWNKMFMDARKEVERAIKIKTDAAVADSKPAEEPLSTGPFDDRGAANKMALRHAEATGVPQEVVEANGKFTIKPMQEASDAVPATPETGPVRPTAKPDTQPGAAVAADESGADVAAAAVDAGAAQPAAVKVEATPALTFKTAKGSVYTVNQDGTTTRDKAARPEHPGEQGVQETSKRTVYVTAGDAQKLGEIQTKGGARKGLAFDDKASQMGVRYLDGKDQGKLERRTVVPFKTEPAIGLTPVEHWGDDKTVHFGNEIIEVTGRKPALKDEHAGQSFKNEEMARRYITEQKINKTHRVKQAGRAQFEIVPKVAEPKADGRKKALDAEAKLNAQIAVANEKAAQRVDEKVAPPATELDAAAHQAATSPLNDLAPPTEAQAEAGNYKKGHATVHGLDITIENPRGSERSGKRPDGSTWSHTMSDHYGYIKRTIGADDEQVDVYVGPKPESNRVYVVDQLDQQSQKFDEHKIMLGFTNPKAAIKAYSSNFDKGWRVGPVRGMSVDEFKDWLKDGDTRKPAAEHQIEPQNIPNIIPAAAKVPELAPKPAKPKQEPRRKKEAVAAAEKPLDHGELNIPGRTKNIDAELDKHKARQAKEQKSAAKTSADEKRSDKLRAKQLFAEHGEAIIVKHGEKLGGKEVRNTLDQMVKWEPKKFIALADKFVKEQAAISDDGGKPVMYSVAADSESITDTPAFKRWFGDSKVTSPDGTPRVVYHGTAGDFSAFDGAKASTASMHATAYIGHYFSASPEIANEFVPVKEDQSTWPITRGPKQGGSVMPVYLAISNPYVMPLAEFRGMVPNGRSKSGIEAARSLREKLESDGHDGIHIIGDPSLKDTMAGDEWHADTWIAFEPEQVKSATGNNGDFDPANADIRYSVDDNRTATAITKLMTDKGGAAIIHRDDIGEITVAYGDTKSGLAHIARRRGAGFFERLPTLLRDGQVYEKPGQPDRIFIGNSQDEAVIRLDRDGRSENWLLSAYEKHPGLVPATDVKQSSGQGDKVFKVMTPDQVKAAITTGPVGSVIARLIEHGTIVIHRSAKTLPKEAGKVQRGVQAVTMPDGTIHFVAGSLNKNNARAVLLHEMFHKGAESLIGTKEWGNLMGRMGSLYRQGEQSSGKAKEFFDKARARVAAAKTKGAVTTRMEVEEFAAYAIEEYETNRENLPAAVRKWVDDLIGMIKAWMVKRYGKQLGQVTPAQLSAFAKLAVMDVAAGRRGELFGPIGELFSVAPPTETPAFKNWFGKSKVVDDGGKPMVMYHGTSKAGFDSFDTYASNYGLMGMGGYFTADPAVASSYTSKGKGDSPGVYPVYLSIKNPIDMDGKADPSAWTQQFDGIDDYHEGGDTNESWYRAAEDMMADEQLPKWEGAEAMQEGLRAMGHDGITHVGGGRVAADGVRHTVFVAFDPEQVKSATGNNGDFDPASPDIRYSVAANAPAATAEAENAAPEGLTPPEQGLLRRVQSSIQDNMNRVRQVQDRITDITGRTALGKSDYYGAETNRPGRIAARLEDAQDQLTGPLMEKLAKSGHTPEQLNELLHAMHAEERNKAVAKINDEMPDGGSGMTTEQANAVLAGYKGNVKLHALANEAREITKATLDLKLAYGLITAEDHEALAKAYDHYVPLKGDGEFGPKIKRAMGHEERDEHILENIARDHDQAVVAGEKNLARQSLLRMALQFPDKDLWTVGVPPKGRRVVKEGARYVVYRDGMKLGEFKSEVEANRQAELWAALGQDHFMNYETSKESGERVKEFNKFLQDNEVMVYLKGNPIRIQIHDEKLAAQLRPLKGDQLHPILEAMRGVNRWLSKIYTGYNPAFILRNTARDALTGSINMLGNEGAGVAAKAWSKYPSALNTMRKWASTKQVPDTKTGRYLTEYRMHGGKVGASWLSDLEQQGKTLQGMFDDARGFAETAKTGSAKRTGRVAWNKTVGRLAHVIEVANQATENALRLSLFIALREEGASVGRAAQAAKSVTVDFDRKGTSTGALGAIYLFFNPAIQGSANAMKTLLKGAHREQAWAALGGLAMLGALAASKGMGDDKDRWLGEGWETRSKNFMFNVGGHPIRIPVSQEFAPFYAFGAAMAEAAHGESKMRSAVRMVSSFIDAYFPLQGAFREESDNHLLDLSMAAVPTMLKPLSESAANRNSFGTQVVPQSELTKDRPDNLKMNRGTKNTVFDKAAQGIAAAGVASGFAGQYENDISKVSPETLKSLWRTYTGGLGQFLTDSGSLAGMLATDPGQVEASDVPIWKDFVRSNDVKPIRGRYYELAREAHKAVTEFEQARKAGDGDAMDAIVKDPAKAQLVGLGRMVRATTKAAAAVRDEEVSVNADPSLSGAEKRARLKEIEKSEEELYRAAIGAFQ